MNCTIDAALMCNYFNAVPSNVFPRVLRVPLYQLPGSNPSHTLSVVGNTYVNSRASLYALRDLQYCGDCSISVPARNSKFGIRMICSIECHFGGLSSLA